MKQINVSTVRQTADVEVIFINANLISKVIKANIAIDDIITYATTYNNAIRPLMTTKLNEDGSAVVDPDTGCEVMTPVLDKNGKPVVEYKELYLDSDQLRSIAENVAPFLRELVKAFEA